MQITPQLLQKYSEGKCSDAEKRAIEQWLQSNTVADDIIKKQTIPDQTESKIWSNIQKSKSQLQSPNRKNTNIYKVMGIAASVILILGISTLFFNSDRTTTYSTAAGEILTVELADKTKVTLNAASTLELSRDFDQNHRTVHLDGEAFFEVAKDASHPFTITTTYSETTVLGTKFNLSAYDGEAHTLTLNEGKVAFADAESDDAKVILLPGEQARLKEGAITTKKVESTLYNAWMNKEMVIVNQSLEEIFDDLERQFGVTILVKDTALYDRKYNGNYKKPTLNTILEDMSFVLKFKYKQEGNTVKIY